MLEYFGSANDSSPLVTVTSALPTQSVENSLNTKLEGKKGNIQDRTTWEEYYFNIIHRCAPRGFEMAQELHDEDRRDVFIGPQVFYAHKGVEFDNRVNIAEVGSTYENFLMGISAHENLYVPGKLNLIRNAMRLIMDWKHCTHNCFCPTSNRSLRNGTEFLRPH